MKLCRYWHPHFQSNFPCTKCGAELNYHAGATHLKCAYCGQVNQINIGAIGLVENGRVYDLSSADPKHCESFSALISNPEVDTVIELATMRAKMGTSLLFAELDIPPETESPHLLPPCSKQEVWAAGVTYLRSRDARIEESAGGGSFYDKVYAADRPELFFKATPNRVVGPGGRIRIRNDAKWNVSEPELTLIISPKGKLVAYTIGNDVSSRDIEGENPLYLPQAKTYKGACALGPCFVLASSVPDPKTLAIKLVIKRQGETVFEGATSISQMKRTFEDLIAYLMREQEFPNGVLLLTGTGVVPPDDFTLHHGDQVNINVPEIGTLRNVVA